MSVLRQANILGQQRLDVPHIRGIESSIAADFDLLGGKIFAGDQPLVIKGFEIITSGAIGAPATNLQLNVASGVVMHPLASEHGTIFSVPAETPAEVLNSTNTNVSGSFTAGQVNYVGLDLRRNADDSTADLVMFMDANTLLETPKNVPLARTLQYKIVISTTDFSSTVYLLPLAKITTNSTNTVTAVEDARPMAYRLGSGGSVPDRLNSFAWSAGRQETTSGDVFAGGDKAIGDLKSWMDAVMTRLWEVGGGQYWYSPTADREMKLVFGQPVIVATADNFQWTLGSNTLQWQSLAVSFGNSLAAYNTIVDGSATVLDNQCLYVDIDRTAAVAVTAHVADLTTLGSPTIPGSRFVIAWRRGNEIFVRDRAYEIGRTINVANTLVSGTVKLKQTAANPADPIVLAMQTGGGFLNTADSGNASAFTGTGNGTGAGFFGTGGTSSGPGIRGVGGTDGMGGIFAGTGSGIGLQATGGDSADAGAKFFGGTGFANGVEGTGADGGGFGGVFQGTGFTPGLQSTGGDQAAGGRFFGGINDSNGVEATGNGAGTGGVFTGGANGAGISATGNGAGIGGVFQGGATNANGIQTTAGGTGTGAVINGGASGGKGAVVTGQSNVAGEFLVSGGNADALTAVPSGTGYALNATTRIRVHGSASSELIVTALNNTIGTVVSGIRNVLFQANSASHAVGFPYTPTAALSVLLSGLGGSAIGAGAVQALNQTSSGAGNSIALEVMQWDGAAFNRTAAFNQHGYLSLVGTSPAVTDSFSNTLTKKNIAKAWITVQFNGTGSPTVLDGFNIDSAAVTFPTATTLRVAFQQDFSNTNYAAIATMSWAGFAAFPYEVSRAVGTCTFSAMDPSGSGTLVDFTASGGILSVVFYGATP